MGATAIMTAVQNILQAQLAGVTPAVVVEKAPPTQLVNDIEVYLLHAGHKDVRKTTNGLIQRHHLVQFRLLVRVAGDPAAVEDIFCDLNDTIAATFYTNHKLRYADQPNGVASDCEIRQDDASHPDSGQYLLIDEEVYYRSRWWLLDVTEYVGYAEA